MLVEMDWTSLLENYGPSDSIWTIWGFVFSILKIYILERKKVYEKNITTEGGKTFEFCSISTWIKYLFLCMRLFNPKAQIICY